MSKRLYEGECQFCGETVGPPEDARPFFACGDITFYPGDTSEGTRIRVNPDEVDADLTVHEECWTAYWGGVIAGQRFYVSGD